MKHAQKKKVLIILGIVIIVWAMALGIYTWPRSEENNPVQSAEQARGLPRDKCMCWVGLGANGQCEASKICE